MYVLWQKVALPKLHMSEVDGCVMQLRPTEHDSKYMAVSDRCSRPGVFAILKKGCLVKDFPFESSEIISLRHMEMNFLLLESLYVYVFYTVAQLLGPSVLWSGGAGRTSLGRLSLSTISDLVGSLKDTNWNFEVNN